MLYKDSIVLLQPFYLPTGKKEREIKGKGGRIKEGRRKEEKGRKRGER
jgi:hypothetical protein